jgi:hypothetical protein
MGEIHTPAKNNITIMYYGGWISIEKSEAFSGFSAKNTNC